MSTHPGSEAERRIPHEVLTDARGTNFEGCTREAEDALLLAESLAESLAGSLADASALCS
jgi:hypothetical protein